MSGANAFAEAENAVKKAKLKAVKDDIEAMRQESIKLSAENAKRELSSKGVTGN